MFIFVGSLSSNQCQNVENTQYHIHFICKQQENQVIHRSNTCHCSHKTMHVGDCRAIITPILGEMKVKSQNPKTQFQNWGTLDVYD